MKILANKKGIRIGTRWIWKGPLDENEYYNIKTIIKTIIKIEELHVYYKYEDGQIMNLYKQGFLNAIAEDNVVILNP